MQRNSVNQLLLIKTYHFTVCILSVLIASILISVSSLCVIEAAQASSSDHKQQKKMRRLAISQCEFYRHKS